MLLDQIKKTNDIKKLNKEQLPALAKEIREFLLEKVSIHGGHIASNLGVVELTIALHRVLNLPEDKIVWDVGHQSYTHKLLTGRRDGFDHLRELDGMSGFPKRKESPCDSFDTGHSTTSISAGLGYVAARDLQGAKYSVVSVIGDGSLTGGMAFEALNNAAQLSTNFIVVLNDNHMSISENVGGISKYLTGIRTAHFYTGLKRGITDALHHVPKVGDQLITNIRKTKSSIKQLVVPGMWFEDMGVTYLGPISGHNIFELEKALEEAKQIDGPVLLHVLTKKGKGYQPAEKAPDKYHGVGPFDLSTGLPMSKSAKESYTSVFGKQLLQEAKQNEKVVALTAAMADGTGLTQIRKELPKQFFDVGIAEQHAVTLAAGMAAGGLKPVVALYSSFLQRAYDQVVHDVALQNLPVVFAVDRAGLVGNDGETHQGLLDISFLRGVPNMTVMAPKNKWELQNMLKYALAFDGPIAIRYPRGAVYEEYADYQEPIELGKSEMIVREKDIAILSYGHMFEEAVKARDILKEKGYSCSLVNGRFAKPIDEEIIRSLALDHKMIAVVEDGMKAGGFGEAVLECVSRLRLDLEVEICAINNCFVEQGSIAQLRHMQGIDGESIAKRITSLIPDTIGE